MRTIFADTSYWVAMTNRRDPWHTAARRVAARIGRARLVTTDTVFIETMGMFCESGPAMRKDVVNSIRALLSKADVTVVKQDHALFLQGVDLYEKRPDKGYSLTDCISILVMRERRITDVLTTDHHFTQEGFAVLITE